MEKFRNSADRLSDLEKNNKELTDKLNLQTGTLQTILDMLSSFVERVNQARAAVENLTGDISEAELNTLALVRVLAKDNATLVETLSKEKSLIKEEELKAKIDMLVQNGNMEEASETDELSLVVFKETKEDGTVITPRAQYLYSNLESKLGEMAKVFLNRSVGEKFKVEESSDIQTEILEVYREVPVKEELDN